MPTIDQAARQFDYRTDAVLHSFDTQLSSVLARAQVRTALSIRSRLSVEPDGTIRATAANIRVIRALPQIFRQVLEAEGYDSVVVHFLQSFDAGVPVFQEILSQITDGFKVKQVTYSAEDRAYFAALKGQTSFSLEDAVDQVSRTARQEAIFAAGGTPFEELAVNLAERLHTTLGEASNIASTGISTFYRTIADTGYQKIEGELQKTNRVLRYKYFGPVDKLTRPFCDKLMKESRAGRTWTRAEIDAMDNQQLANVFQTCGGYRCRHQWLVVMIS